MRRTLITFLLLFILFISTFYIARGYGNDDDNKPFTNTVSVPDVNKQAFTDYKFYQNDIEKYRLGVPRFEGYPEYVKTYSPKPPSFIPGYRQPIDGIVPGNYKSTLDPTNLMFPDMYLDGCKDNCMDMQKGYYDNLLNKE